MCLGNFLQLGRTPVCVCVCVCVCVYVCVCVFDGLSVLIYMTKCGSFLASPSGTSAEEQPESNIPGAYAAANKKTHYSLWLVKAFNRVQRGRARGRDDITALCVPPLTLSHTLTHSHTHTHAHTHVHMYTHTHTHTGTPIQNELLEYYALVEFCNPGLLGCASEFRKRFEGPILRSRDSLATDKVQQLAKQSTTPH